jgi:hypothetical protein
MGLGGLLKGLAGGALTVASGGTLAPALIGGALGAAKHFMVDKPAEKRSRELAAETIRYSPWTGMSAPAIKQGPGLFASALQGGAIGSMYGGSSNQPQPQTTTGEVWKNMPLGQKQENPLDKYMRQSGMQQTALT